MIIYYFWYDFCPLLLVADGCESEPTAFSDSLEWPETDLGQIVNISCPCGDFSLGVGHPVAQRQCTGSFTSGAEWATARDSACNFTTSIQQLCNASQVCLLCGTGSLIQRMIPHVINYPTSSRFPEQAVCYPKYLS